MYQALSEEENEIIVRLKQTRSSKRILLMGSPEYNNLGDLAIAYCTKKFVNCEFPSYEFIEITERLVLNNLSLLTRYINKKDLLLLNGGGNISDLYMDQQSLRHKVIKKFRNNAIICMPQTVFFTQSNKGKKQLISVKKLFKYHPNLCIFAREIYSYSLMKQYFTDVIINICPDIVLYHSFWEVSIHRKNILLCLRNDLESALNIQQKNAIIYACKKIANIDIWDTCLKYNVNLNLRDKEVEKSLSMVASHSLMITDRLHGLIFAVITGTPCVVLTNFNHKISGICEWLKNYEYIQMIEKVNNVDEIARIANTLLTKYPNGEKKINSVEQFYSLKKCIEERLK